MDITLIGGVGIDDNGRKIKNLLEKYNIKSTLVKDKSYRTILKTRYLSDSKQLMRVDEDNFIFKNNRLKYIKKTIDHFDIVIVSDYGKGFIDSLGKNFLYSISKKKKIFVDPKGQDYSKYRGSFLVKPNQNEFDEATIKYNGRNEKSLSQTLCKKFNLKNLLITKGSNGMCLHKKNKKKIYNIKSLNSEVYDVTGAGDTVISSLVYFHSQGYQIEEAINLARDAAGISVTKIGNYQINQLDLKKDKVIRTNQIKKLSKLLKNKSKKIVFTNGVFDILHAGHIDLLQKAKRLGDILIVAVNDDVSVKKNKGPLRPINNIKKRLKVLSSIRYIDFIIVFKDKTPLKLIRDLKPNILVKGADYKVNQIIGAKEVKKNNGIIKTIPFKYNLSSTDILKKI